MFFNKHFTCFTFFGVEGINFGNLQDKIFLKINGMVEGLVGRKLIVSGFNEHISEVRAKGRDGHILGLFRDGEFHGYGDFVNVFSLGRILMKRPLNPRKEVNGEVDPIDDGIPLLELGHAEDDLRVREANNHELHLLEKEPVLKEMSEVQQMVPLVLGVPSTLNAVIGVGRALSLKMPFGRSRGSMKFPVAPKSMSARVSTFFLRPCREIGICIVLFSWDAMSTWFNDWEGDVEVASLLKNPVLCELQWGMWIFQLILQVLHSTS